MPVRIFAAIAALASILMAPARAGEPNWPDDLTIGAASPGGTYHVYGAGLAHILTRELGLPVVMRPTEGPAENIALMEAGEAKLGFVTAGVALQAWNATGLWAGKPPARSLRVMFPMYDTPFQFIALQDANIRSIADMAGKRIGIGPRGGTSATYFPDIFKALKVPADFVFGDWADLAGQMHARAIDAMAVGAGVPFPSFIELEFRDRVRYVALSPQQIATLRLAMPELTPSIVPAGTIRPCCAITRRSACTISRSAMPTCRTISSTTSFVSYSNGTRR